MTFKNDYLLGLIEKLAAAIAQIAAGKGTRPANEEVVEIDALLKGALNIDPMFLFANLSEVLKNIDRDLAFPVAQLLFLRMQALDRLNRYSESSQITAVDFSIKCLEGKTKTKALDLLARHLVCIKDSPTLEKLLQLFEENQRFANAEDVVFQLISNSQETYLEVGLAFYERIQQLDDDLLDAGGLPRIEVKESFDELMGLR